MTAKAPFLANDRMAGPDRQQLGMRPAMDMKQALRFLRSDRSLERPVLACPWPRVMLHGAT